MFVLIAGGGRTGARLASLLLNEGHKIRLVENRPALLARLHQELATENIVEGNPRRPGRPGAGRHPRGARDCRHDQ